MSKNGKVVVEIKENQIKLSSGKEVEKKLSSKKVKNVKKAREIVKTNISMMNKFLFNSANII